MRNETSLPGAFKSSEVITLGDVMSSYELGLVMIAGSAENALDSPVQWVHSSDLKHPAPFLTPRTVLLTTGAQFTKKASLKIAEEYTAELLEAGVTALGFAVDMVHSRIPQALITACEELHLPLFRVPYDTPFIQISQRAARLLAAKSYAREIWSLDTGRAIARSATKSQGLNDAIATLASRLERFVALTAKSGQIIFSAGPHEYDIDATLLREYTKELGKRKGQSYSSKLIGAKRLHLQTIPGLKSSSGTLIVEAEKPLDHAEITAVELVATLAAFALEKESQLARAAAKIQGVIVGLLVKGETKLALELARAAGVRLTEEAKHIIFFGPESEAPESAIDSLQSELLQGSGSLTATHEGNLIMVTTLRDYRALTNLLKASQTAAGASTLSPLASLEKALTEAKTAYLTASASNQLVQYEPSLELGILSRLAGDKEAVSRAKLFLSPLTERDEKYDDELTRTLFIWLKNHGVASATSQELNLHRHTIANRVKLIGDLLQRDLQDAGVRAECWSALNLLGFA